SDLCKLLLESYEKDSDRIDFVFDLETIRVPLDTAIPLGLILNETITNALKHAFPDNRKGRIRIGLKKTERDHFDLFIVDDGVGVAPEFKLEDAESIGLKTVFTLAEQIRATVRVTTDSGIAWRISFKNIQVAPRI
ncbi:MAG: sensor histidine kinase, partial [Treponemataceae bacterium]